MLILLHIYFFFYTFAADYALLRKKHITAMKKSIFITLISLVLSTIVLADAPKHEFRATWLATVSGIDWPKTKATSDSKREQQKQELINILDKMKAGNMNAVCMQVRSLCDAMYVSSYEPWSVALTGTRGKDPGYDPLQFAIDETHKRGMELHVWVNPFRASTSTLASSDVLWNNAGDWLIKYNNNSFSGYIIDPGYPESRAYVVKVLMEIVNKYDIDGMVMDDYFYAYGGTTNEDAKAQAKHYNPSDVIDVNGNGNTLDDWRRSNVDKVIKATYDSIQAVKPWVRFGMGPGGIWTIDNGAARAYGIKLPTGITGGDIYNNLYCNTVEWVKGGYVDYVNPQIYWSTQVAAQDFDVLCEWWAKDVCEHFSDQLPDGKRVHFFPSTALYKVYNGSNGFEDGVKEIERQMDATRTHLSSGYAGAVHYNTTSYLEMYEDLAKSHYIYEALPPPMAWKVQDSITAPNNLKLSGTTLTWSHPTETRFTVYAYPKGTGVKTATRNPLYLQGIVFGNSFNTSTLGSLTNTTIAVYTYDRYGVEHGVALYNADPNATEEPEPENPDPGTDPDPKPEPTIDITWVLNGGQLPTVEVPTNQQLWDQFKADFDEFYSAIYPNYQIQDYPIHAVLELTWPKWSDNCFVTEFITQHPDWIWLGEYIQSVYGKITDVKIWRYNLYAFFNATDEVRYESGQVINVSCGDFIEAGLPSVWGPAYQAAKGMITLPTQVTSEYTLPTNLTHPEGYPFLGWWDNATFAGDQLYSIPAYWKGTLYANWEGWNPPTSIENIDWSQPVEIYDIMGHRVTRTEQMQGNILIIKQGNNIYKFIK